MKYDEESQPTIVFRLDTKLCGVHVSQIREIMRVGELSAVPSAPDYVIGVTNLRGKVATVIDLRKRLGIPSKELDKNSRMMIMEANGQIKGMVVDAVEDVTTLLASNIEPTPEALTTDHSDYVRGIAKKDDKLIVLIDMDKLVNNQNKHSELEPVSAMVANLEVVAAVKGQKFKS